LTVWTFEISPSAAENVIEQLRYGIPPSVASLDFTVGRDSQIRDLLQSLEREQEKGALLVHANYGSGKGHLLRVLRELALQRGYATSLIVADAQGGVRFNRMDIVFGAICRELEVPENSAKGVGVLFDAYQKVSDCELGQSVIRERAKVSSKGKWDFSDRLTAPGIYVALRAWVHEGDNRAIRDLIEDWLSSPERYRSQRKLLYRQLVGSLRNNFLDSRPEWQFYADEVFAFHTGGHRQAWDALADLHRISLWSGYRGLILLVDEFEDVIQNLTRRNYQQVAFHNLFRFFAGDRFPGRTYFAVTPDFAQKCKRELLSRGVYDFDYNSFDNLPYFRLAPINVQDAVTLAKRIREVHAIAYDWKAHDAIGDSVIQQHCKRQMKAERPDKIRQTIISTVELLDSRLDGS